MSTFFISKIYIETINVSFEINKFRTSIIYRLSLISYFYFWDFKIHGSNTVINYVDYSSNCSICIK